MYEEVLKVLIFQTYQHFQQYLKAELLCIVYCEHEHVG